MDKKQFQQLLQRRIAQMAVSPSAIRNQGADGLIKKCRDYFEKQIDLEVFQKSIAEELTYKQFLNDHTQNLLQEFPSNAKSWGAVRKALNLFLRDLAYNTYIVDMLKLPSDFNSSTDKLKNLEVPLDKDVALGLCGKFETGLPKWNGLKNLTHKDSEVYQTKAAELANQKEIARVHLDLLFWRAKR